MKLVFNRFIFMLCACFAVFHIVDAITIDPKGVDALYQLGQLCISLFLCALFYEYMDFNHPSKKL